MHEFGEIHVLRGLWTHKTKRHKSGSSHHTFDCCHLSYIGRLIIVEGKLSWLALLAAICRCNIQESYGSSFLANLPQDFLAGGWRSWWEDHNMTFTINEGGSNICRTWQGWFISFRHRKVFPREVAVCPRVMCMHSILRPWICRSWICWTRKRRYVERPAYGFLAIRVLLTWTDNKRFHRKLLERKKRSDKLMVNLKCFEILFQWYLWRERLPKSYGVPC